MIEERKARARTPSATTTVAQLIMIYMLSQLIIIAAVHRLDPRDVVYLLERDGMTPIQLHLLDAHSSDRYDQAGTYAWVAAE